jgi:hypothetical protein
VAKHIRCTPTRTRLLLRVRRRFTAGIATALHKENNDKPEDLRWPAQAIDAKADEAVKMNMQRVLEIPNRGLRQLARTLQAG